MPKEQKYYKFDMSDPADRQEIVERAEEDARDDVEATWPIVVHELKRLDNARQEADNCYANIEYSNQYCRVTDDNEAFSDLYVEAYSAEYDVHVAKLQEAISGEDNA